MLIGWLEVSKLPFSSWPDISLDPLTEWENAIVWQTFGHSQHDGRPSGAIFAFGFEEMEFIYLWDKELYVSSGASYPTIDKFKKFCAGYGAIFRTIGPDDE